MSKEKQRTVHKNLVSKGTIFIAVSGVNNYRWRKPKLTKQYKVKNDGITSVVRKKKKKSWRL